MDNGIAFWGHRTEDGRVQLLLAHLQGVSELAGKFADAFGECAIEKRVYRF